MKSKKIIEKKKIKGPIGIKIISILYYIGAALAVIVGIGVISSWFFIESIEPNYFENQIPIFAALGGALFVVMGVILVGLGVLGVFTGIGLWKGRPWARKVAIILACLGLIDIVWLYIRQDQFRVIGLIFHAVIGGYLLFSKKVKASFR